MDKSDRIERRLKLHDMRVLMSVVRAGSMSKAAAQLGTVQPALSRSIAELEHALGVRLLDRSPRGVEPTAYGRALIKRGIAVFDELRQGVRDIEFLADPTAGELRIGATEAIAGMIVSPLIESLSRRHRRMEFHVVTGDLGQHLRSLADRNIEFALSRLHRPIADDQFTVENLFHDSYAVVAGRKSPWARQRRIQLADLVNERWTMLPPDTLPGVLQAEAFRASGLEPPRATVSTHSFNVHNRLLATGRFLAIQPSFSLRLPGRNPSLTILPVELPSTRRPIVIVTLKNRILSPPAQLFLERLRDVVKPLKKMRTDNPER
jgi:DNA-binding transcriptional LysR family regulator